MQTRMDDYDSDNNRNRILGSAKTNRSPPYFYQLSERSQSLSAIRYVSFSAHCDFPLFSRKILSFPWKKCLANNKFLVSRLPGSTFSTALNAKGTMVPAVRALDIFSSFQQSSTATKYPDELTEIYKTQGIIQLVSQEF